jgi:hypothetical protein
MDIMKGQRATSKVSGIEITQQKYHTDHINNLSKLS